MRKRTSRGHRWPRVVVAIALGVGAQQNGLQHANNFTSTEYYGPTNQQQIKSILSGPELAPAGRIAHHQTTQTRNVQPGRQAGMGVNAPECVYDTFKGVANSPGHLQVRTGDGKIRTMATVFCGGKAIKNSPISNNVCTCFENGAKNNYQAMKHHHLVAVAMLGVCWLTRKRTRPGVLPTPRARR